MNTKGTYRVQMVTTGTHEPNYWWAVVQAGSEAEARAEAVRGFARSTGRRGAEVVSVEEVQR